MDHSLKVNKTNTGKEGVLSLRGNLTMIEAQETKKTLLEAIADVDTLYLDISGIEAIDVSFIQLICAAHRECFLAQKEIYMRGDVSETLEIFLTKAGYSKQQGCLTGAKTSCVWSTANNK